MRIQGLCLALMLAGSLAACGEGPTSAPATAAVTSTPAPIELQLVEAVALPSSIPIVATAIIAALHTSAIGALVEGPVERLHVRVGVRARKGQPLLRIRLADYERRVAEAAAAQRITQAQVDQAERALARIAELSERGFATSDGSECRIAMGFIVIRGLATSTLLTLVVLPAAYVPPDDAERWVPRLGRSRRLASISSGEMQPDDEARRPPSKSAT